MYISRSIVRRRIRQTKLERRNFIRMKQIAHEMNLYTRALTPPVAAKRAIKVFDICM